MSDVLTCWDLLRGAADGVAAERERFCLTYGPVIRDFLGRRWNRRALAQEIEDAEQETLIECLREKGALERAVDADLGSFRGFLFGVTMNVARRFEERRARIAGREAAPRTGDPPPVEPDADPEKDFDRAWATGVVRRARQQLEARAAEQGEASLRRCEILRLRFFEDLPIRKIASKLGQDPARVHHEYARVRSDFRDALHSVVRFEAPGGEVDLDTEVRFLLANLE
ncbi:MAG: sigma-70 family RNA polymerase sigma factor [Planctomycetota bacterium]|nr:sigma-70 family RNA polymerase sigma factor [Planctomycetota bacterium]